VLRGVARYDCGCRHNPDVGRNGRLRFPLESFFSRRSLEFFWRRITTGATRFPAARRGLRPASQSSHEIALPIGTEGALRFEFTSYLADQCFTFVQDTILAGFRKPSNDAAAFVVASKSALRYFAFRPVIARRES
jgi:hypothetical protein